MPIPHFGSWDCYQASPIGIITVGLKPVARGVPYRLPMASAPRMGRVYPADPGRENYLS